MCDSVRADLSIVNTQWYQLCTVVSGVSTTCDKVRADLSIVNAQWYQVCLPRDNMRAD